MSCVYYISYDILKIGRGIKMRETLILADLLKGRREFRKMAMEVINDADGQCATEC